MFLKTRTSGIKVNGLSLFFLMLIIGSCVPGCDNNKFREKDGMIFIPAGQFIMGTNEVDKDSLGREFGARQGALFEDEKPVREMFLDGFYIDKFEVTNIDYKRFCDETDYLPPPTWEQGLYIKDQEKRPVENVSWFDANNYCKWTGKRLLTEEEWEKSARGPKGNMYPWGNEFDINKTNLNLGDTVPVGSKPEDKSYYGIYDMGGNVMEWTASWFKPYPGSSQKLKDFGEKYRVLRGGAGSTRGHYKMSRIYSRSTYRHYYLPGGKGNDGGIRCGRDG